MWWRALSVLGIANVGLWLAIWQCSPNSDPYHSVQLALSGVYVLVCAYRSIFPRVDLERLVVVDSTISSIFLGRSFATVAEICFGIDCKTWQVMKIFGSGQCAAVRVGAGLSCSDG